MNEDTRMQLRSQWEQEMLEQIMLDGEISEEEAQEHLGILTDSELNELFEAWLEEQI